jgi:RHS repeat-associated protein
MAQQLGSNYYNSPYKFNGKELDEETGFYYYGARYYDPRISIWQSVDPLAEKFFNRNPYEYCFSNPINLTDPTGMGPEENPSGGHLYGTDGTYYGQMKNTGSESEAYVINSNKIKKLSDGSYSFKTKNVKKLSVDNATLNKFANTVAEESSGNKKESFGIASVINNISSAKDQEISVTLTKGIYGYDNGGNDPSYKNNSEYSMEAAINALSGGHDYSNGATKWDGKDFLIWGLNSPDGTPQNKFEEYGAIYIEASIYGRYAKSINGSRRGGNPDGVFKDMSNWKMPSLSAPWCGFMYDTKVSTRNSLDATSTHGCTIFWKVIKE